MKSIKLKKNILTTFVAILLSPIFVFAGAPGGAVSDSVAIPHYSVDAIGAGSSAGSLAVEAAQLARTQVLDVVANQLQNQLILQLQTDVIKWAKSGFYGQPSFIKNPESYFNNLGKVAIRVQLNKVSVKTGDPEADKIITNIIRTQRIDEKEILDKVKSDLGTVVKTNVCNDKSLSDIASGDVAKAEGKTALSQSDKLDAKIKQEVEKRKKELYDSYCKPNTGTSVGGATGSSGNTSGLTQQTRSNQTQAQANAAAGAQNKALEDAFRNNFAMGGYASFLALTRPNEDSGTQNYIAKDTIDKAVATKIEGEKSELLQGGGYRAQKVCKKYSMDESKLAIAEANGVSRDTNCEEWENKTSPSETQSNVNSSIKAPTERLASTQGFGAVLTQAVLAGVMARIINEAKGSITGSFTGATANSKISLNSNDFLTLDQLLNNGTINNGSVTETRQNDIKTVDERSDSTQSIAKVLKDDMASLLELEEATIIARASIIRYQPFYDDLAICREKASVLPDFKTKEPGISIESGFLERKQEYEKLRIQTDEYIRNMPSYMAIVNNVSNKINNSSSSQEIRDIYQDYENSKTSGAIPGPGSTGIFRAQSGSLKSRVDIELDESYDSDQSQQKTIRKLIKECHELVCVSWTIGRDGKKTCAKLSDDPLRDADKIKNPDQEVAPGDNDDDNPIGGA